MQYSDNCSCTRCTSLPQSPKVHRGQNICSLFAHYFITSITIWKMCPCTSSQYCECLYLDFSDDQYFTVCIISRIEFPNVVLVLCVLAFLQIHVIVALAWKIITISFSSELALIPKTHIRVFYIESHFTLDSPHFVMRLRSLENSILITSYSY